MTTKLHAPKILEITDSAYILDSPEALMELMWEHDCTALIVRRENLLPVFFELASGFAGEMLQKISTYNLRFAVVGNFAHEPSKALRDFIRESNRVRRVLFVATPEEAVAMWAGI